MGDFRARDADRDRAVEVIETAYVDGQLGDADRELRVARALSAATLGELEGLTRDLQVPAAPALAAASPSLRARPRRGGLAVAGGVAAAAGVLALVPFVFLASSSDQSAPPPGSESARAIEVPAVAEPAAAFEMTPGQVRRFLKGYERKFGTREAFEVSFFPDRAQAQVPVRGARPRMERWTWNGRWRQDTEASAVAGPLRLVDVGSIDVRRLFANIATARRTLEVDGGRFTHARLVRWDTDPVELNIYISNDFKETGYLSTTPAGEVRHSQPYEA
jgi:hypothetical protein